LVHNRTTDWLCQQDYQTGTQWTRSTLSYQVELLFRRGLIESESAEKLHRCRHTFATGLDTTGPSGRLIFHVMGAVAEFERDLIRERTRAGMRAAKRRGKRIGRPRANLPLAGARRLLAQGRSLSETARELGVARTTLRRALAHRSV
jgi:DNA invertase Pin-like site-specific DNA recombinase